MLLILMPSGLPLLHAVNAFCRALAAVLISGHPDSAQWQLQTPLPRCTWGKALSGAQYPCTTVHELKGDSCQR